jgi:hypothetical protein
MIICAIHAKYISAQNNHRVNKNYIINSFQFIKMVRANGGR